MKKLLITTVFTSLFITVSAQEKTQDSTKIEALDEVLVQAVRVDADSPITHSNLDKEELEKRNLGQDIPYMLNYLPSVVTTSDAGAGVGYTYIRVRGSDASRVNVTLNGIPYNDSESQGTFWVNLPDFTSSVQSLQLQRGVGTSTNGSGAFGASLNLLSDAVSEEAYGEIANSFGSYNTHKHNIKFSTGLLSEHFELAGRLSTIQSDGYIDRASSDLKSYFLQGAFVNRNTLIKALVFGGREETYQSWNGLEDPEKLENDRTFNSAGMYTDEDGNIQFYDNEVDNYAQDHYQLLWNQRFSNNWSTNVSLNYTKGEGYFEQYKENEDFETYGFEPIEIGGDTINTTDLIRRRWLDNDFYAANANVNYKNNKIDFTGGAFYSYYTGDHFGEVIWARYASDSEIRDRYYEGNGEKSEFTVFSKATYRINEKWSVFGDLQGRFLNYNISGITSDLEALTVDEDYSFFNPKAGLTYKLNPSNQFYFSYGKAHREPSRNDYEQGIVTPEKLDDFELGWRFATEKAKVNTNIYYMNYKDQLVLSGELNDVGAPLRTSSGKSYRLGLEVDAEIQLLKNLRTLPNIALSTNKNVDFVTSRDGDLVNLGNTNISFSPSVVAGNMLEYSPIQNLQLGFLSKFVGEQYMGNIDSEASKLDSYFVNDFNIVYTLDSLPWVKEVVFSALVNNIFNVEYISNGYFYTYDDDFSNPGTVTTVEGAGYYPQATINFLVGATVKF
ncbi:TonB-dependent receptor [Aequorivita vladivostokensis]|uniref:TonB-dependent receptor n=1 Tax=Aequorivita vladivostokensis TaxID=171194 RepID=A0ABR5DFX6_9FLAO|nr:TonB-dependent receptor [Aequorivita vladivostokensis]KJJ37677.1 TonB-dependent receptor [Aequorivita vladivostokensis]MBF31608.1 TonB-dependent receptor [Aequorivita sp.]HAV54008.1 TonB-dependent receptor [Aequorivita sp.]|tara:strand:- start:51733 stop:53913 length:2181 start_codon:yes stop_codon:yes gene_type:complete